MSSCLAYASDSVGALDAPELLELTCSVSGDVTGVCGYLVAGRTHGDGQSEVADRVCVALHDVAFLARLLLFKAYAWPFFSSSVSHG